MNRPYCQFCGNVHVTKATFDKPCAACRKILEGPLKRGYAHYKKFSQEHSRCCGKLSSEKDHLFFHGKHFEGCYPAHDKPDAPQVCVEYGVKFYNGGAATYYIRDFDHYCDSEEYGDFIEYRTKGFWEKLDAQLDKAPFAAWNDDLLSCPECGYHMTDGVCSCQEDPDE